MPIETFDVTDNNGARATGTAEAFRDPDGPFYDPKSEYYQHPRFSNRNIRFIDDRDLCRIDRSVLRKAVQEAFKSALIKLGIPDPGTSAVESDVSASIAEALRGCAPMSRAAPRAAPQEPPPLLADLIIDKARRQQQASVGRPQSQVFDAGTASPPLVPTAAPAPMEYGSFARDPAQGKRTIRRLTRVQPS